LTRASIVDNERPTLGPSSANPGHLTRWERIALVSDVEWIPAAMKTFPLSQAAEARTWIIGAN
jgi:hypothetical protein